METDIRGPTNRKKKMDIAKYPKFRNTTVHTPSNSQINNQQTRTGGYVSSSFISPQPSALSPIHIRRVASSPPTPLRNAETTENNPCSYIPVRI
ncbi:hypothetical protein N7527_000364 [Penicillium freii]|nr:hypothetical protein N7527_000364 [Penicillium freii]